MADTIGPDSRYITDVFVKVAGYRTGGPDVIWNPGDILRFQGHTSLVSIDQSDGLSVYGKGLADVADIERGAGTIDHFLPAAQERARVGKDNNLYCSWDNLPSNVMRCLTAKLDVSKIGFWVANWNLDQAQASELVGEFTLDLGNGQKIVINIVAVQWASPSSNPDTILPGSSMTLKQANIDLSETADNWYPWVPPPAVRTMVGVVVTNDLHTFKIASHDNGRSWIPAK